MKYDVYLAGPFFNPKQKGVMKELKSNLVEFGLKVADPQTLGPVISDTSSNMKTPKFFADIFNGNVNAMAESFCVLACLDGKDVGTAFELGWFHHAEKMIFTFSSPDEKTNVMLTQAADAHFSNCLRLEVFLTLNARKIIDREMFSVPESVAEIRMETDQ